MIYIYVTPLFVCFAILSLEHSLQQQRSYSHLYQGAFDKGHGNGWALFEWIFVSDI